ncbi:hypothetical protein [Acetobacter conturbans]|uniref:Uncharacterized protein n=1 Tax=Acetobacter conturbans TaxID=1737472 RepID=A0ABX0K221_9PROT|nr:hypothetical protein [Acetobacter conturbans]NHN88866.1 hypothetical protein [Acetobacter conturbans]
MSEDALTEVEKVNIRRYCWYPAYGNSNLANTWLYFSHYGILEYRLNNFAPEEITVVRTMLSTLTTLELGPSQAADNLDTDKAAVWTHNQNEVSDRIKLFRQQRMELVRFIGIPPGPGCVSSTINLAV